jgi:hypothetical protein
MKCKSKIIARTNRNLENPAIQRKIWLRDQLVHTSRRKVPIAIHQSLHAFDGYIVWPDDTPYRLPLCIYLEFDLENRWYSWFKQAGLRDKMAINTTMFTRLRLLDLWQQAMDNKN